MLAAHFDVLIIGGGQAGIPLAHALAGAGWKVALAERKHLGGSCVNFGCTPTKAAIASARVAHLARRGHDFGLRIPTVEVDFPAVIERARRISLESRWGLDKGLEGKSNPQLFREHARIKGCGHSGFHTRLGEQEITAGQIVLNTGTRSRIPTLEGLSRIDYLTAENWLQRTQLPERLAILGGGYIGLEMGQFYQRMGSQVTVWEEAPAILQHEDEDVSSALQELLEQEGMQFHTGTRIESVEQLSAPKVFVAVGRQPNTDDLGLETVNVAVDDQGYVKIDERLATSVKGIWAAGDIRGGPLFTHTSWDDFRILRSQLIGDHSHTTDRIVPYAVFTDPELGRVGLTEREAHEKGLKYQVKKFEMRRNGKARELGEPEGLIKVLIEEGSGHILGAAVLSADAAELVHMYVDLMNAKAGVQVIRDAVHIHPTLAEGIQSAVN